MGSRDRNPKNRVKPQMRFHPIPDLLITDYPLPITYYPLPITAFIEFHQAHPHR